MTIRATALAAIILALASSELLLTAGSPREAGHAATAPGRSKRQAPPQPRVKYIADHADRLSGRARRSHQGAGFEDFFGASPEEPLLTYAETLCEESDGEGTFSLVNCSDADELQIWADDHPGHFEADLAGVHCVPSSIYPSQSSYCEPRTVLFVIMMFSDSPARSCDEDCMRANLWNASTWTDCASEGGACFCQGDVRYGSGDTWTASQPADGNTVACSGAAFGDLAPAANKRCECEERHDVDALWRASSYGQLWIDENRSDVITVNIDQPESDFASADLLGSCQASALFNAGRAATAAAGYDYNDYDHESFMLPEIQQNMRCSFAGLGQQPGRITWNVYTSPRVIGHELGHNLGFGHSRRGPDDDDNGRNPATGGEEYGDLACVMGSSPVAYNGAHRRKAGWIVDGHGLQRLPGLGTCENTDGGLTDVDGDGCAAYESGDGWWCGRFDDADFSSTSLCCTCGGGVMGITDTACATHGTVVRLSALDHEPSNVDTAYVNPHGVNLLTIPRNTGDRYSDEYSLSFGSLRDYGGYRQSRFWQNRVHIHGPSNTGTNHLAKLDANVGGVSVFSGMSLGQVFEIKLVLITSDFADVEVSVPSCTMPPTTSEPTGPTGPPSISPTSPTSAPSTSPTSVLELYCDGNNWLSTSANTCVNLAPFLKARLVAARSHDSPVPLSGGNDNSASNLRACVGECDASSQCAEGLSCFQRSNGETIPGCYGDGDTGGGAAADWDYCYDPALMPYDIYCNPDQTGLRASPVDTARLAMEGVFGVTFDGTNWYGDGLGMNDCALRAELLNALLATNSHPTAAPTIDTASPTMAAHPPTASASPTIAPTFSTPTTVTSGLTRAPSSVFSVDPATLSCDANNWLEVDVQVYGYTCAAVAERLYTTIEQERNLTTDPVALSGGNDNFASNLQACVGECDASSQCAEGLSCFQRSNGETIPGCYGDGDTGGGAAADWDYCYDPALMPYDIYCNPKQTVLRASPVDTARLAMEGVFGVTFDGTNWYGDGLGMNDCALRAELLNALMRGFTTDMPTPSPSLVPSSTEPTPQIPTPPPPPRPEVTFIGNLLADPSFEGTGATRSHLVHADGNLTTGWTGIDAGFTLTTEPSEVRSGVTAAKVSSTGSAGGGLSQTLVFQESAGEWPTKVRVRGCARGIAITGCGEVGAPPPTDCAGFSIVVDATLAGGGTIPVTSTTQYDPAVAGYHCREVVLSVPEGIQQVQFQARLQPPAAGAAVFDDFDAVVMEPSCWGDLSYCHGIRTTFGP